VRRARRRLGVRSPFFASLIQHVEVRIVPTNASSLVSNASDTGPDEDEEWGAVAKEETIYLKGARASRLSDEELEGLLLHGLTHIAWQHAARRGHRDPGRWELSADILANEAVSQMEGPELVAGAVRAPDLSDRNVEAIYAILGEEESSLENLLTFHGREGAPEDSLPGVHLLHDPDEKELRNKWRRTLRRAHMIAERAQGGDLPAGLEREYDRAIEAQVDWRSALRRYLSPNRSDYSGINLRRVHRGRYVRKLAVQNLQVRLCLDTSGSVSKKELSAFISEVRAITDSRERVQAELYYNDVELHGPHHLAARCELPDPVVGGGGTDFRPFFSEALDQNTHAGSEVLVYFTDGYGTFPPEPPQNPALWVVPRDGRPAEDFPFGEVIRLRET
jgi:predicted metal-dependent peptidase